MWPPFPRAAPPDSATPNHALVLVIVTVVIIIVIAAIVFVKMSHVLDTAPLANG